MLKFNQLKFKDIVTKDFGGKVTIRVNAESVKHYARKVRLLEKVEAMKLSDEDQTAFNISVGLMAICTNPKTGDYTFADDQIDDFVERISIKLFTQLAVANRHVNPANFEDEDVEPKTLKGKKKAT